MNARTANVWKRCAQWYGARWFDTYGNQCPREWEAVINRTDEKRLEAGLAAARRASQIYPFTLGQLEAAIPKRHLPGEKPIADQLTDYVKANLTLCQHQNRGPWSFFYHNEDDGSRYGAMTISGVTISECKECSRPSHRVRTDELNVSHAGAA